MASLSAPNVWQPLYECAPQVVVTGYVPGATIDIYAIPPGPGSPSRIGGGVSVSATGQVFGVAVAKMVAGAKVYATQTYGGTTSPPSPDVILQSALSVDPPLLPAPLLECARCVRVEGMLPGASAQVRDGVAVLGTGSAYSGAAHVGVSPALVAGHTITARQVYCGAPGPDSPGLSVGPVREERKLVLPAPEVQDPLYACQQYAVVSGCTPGADAELFVNTVPTAGTCAAGTSVTLWVTSGLVEGTAITARQQLCGGAIQSPMSAPVVVRPAADIPRPAIRGPLYEGDTSVVVAMTVAGEVVTIQADGTQVGMGGAGGGDAALNVDPPLKAGQSVVATVELCGVKKTSLPVIVRGRPITIPAPKVVPPLYACSLLVPVADCLPGATVRVYATAGATTVLLGLARTFGNSIVVGVTPLLQAGWQITATQEVGGVASSRSAPEVVQPALAPPPPRLRAPIFECARCVRVEAVVPGARVDVYANGVWIGGADAWTTRVEVGVYPPLALGAAITATQSVCGKVSQPAKATAGAAPRELPAPTISLAYAGASFAVVEDLVPGATVEIEEISTYNLVIGKACATEKAESVWLSLPLFAGARLRARQLLCTASPFSPTFTVGQPPEWPLGDGPFKAGFREVTDVPVSPDVAFISSQTGVGGQTYTFQRPAQNAAIIFYPATAEGVGVPFAAGGPFPLLVFGHAKRVPWSHACPGAPTDTTQDFRQLSGILAHLARWGFVTIAPDLSWLAVAGVPDWQFVLKDAVSYMLTENLRAGSPFNGKIKTTGLGAMGHSTGGLAATFLGTSGAFPIEALGLIAPAATTMGDVAQIGTFAPKPVLVLHGTQDAGPYSADGQPLNIYAAAAAKKHLVTIDGANHFGYTDGLCIQEDGAATISQANQQRIAKAYLTAFFRRYLRGATEVDDYLTGVRKVEELEAFTITVQFHT